MCVWQCLQFYQHGKGQLCVCGRVFSSINMERNSCVCVAVSSVLSTWKGTVVCVWQGGGGGVDPIPCVSTHRISDLRLPSFSPHTSSSAATPTGSVHKSQTVSVVGMSGQLKRCNESWFGSLQSGQFAAGWLAGSILCR